MVRLLTSFLGFGASLRKYLKSFVFTKYAAPSDKAESFGSVSLAFKPRWKLPSME